MNTDFDGVNRVHIRTVRTPFAHCKIPHKSVKVCNGIMYLHRLFMVSLRTLNGVTRTFTTCRQLMQTLLSPLQFVFIDVFPCVNGKDVLLRSIHYIKETKFSALRFVFTCTVSYVSCCNLQERETRPRKVER